MQASPVPEFTATIAHYLTLNAAEHLLMTMQDEKRVQYEFYTQLILPDDYRVTFARHKEIQPCPRKHLNTYTSLSMWTGTEGL